MKRQDFCNVRTKWNKLENTPLRIPEGAFVFDPAKKKKMHSDELPTRMKQGSGPEVIYNMNTSNNEYVEIRCKDFATGGIAKQLVFPTALNTRVFVKCGTDGKYYYSNDIVWAGGTYEFHGYEKWWEVPGNFGKDPKVDRSIMECEVPANEKFDWPPPPAGMDVKEDCKDIRIPQYGSFVQNTGMREGVIHKVSEYYRFSI